MLLPLQLSMQGGAFFIQQPLHTLSKITEIQGQTLKTFEKWNPFIKLTASAEGLILCCDVCAYLLQDCMDVDVYVRVVL